MTTSEAMYASKLAYLRSQFVSDCIALRAVADEGRIACMCGQGYAVGRCPKCQARLRLEGVGKVLEETK